MQINGVPITQVGLDGWINPFETWAYSNASTITVPTGAASRYQIGDRLKLTQTTVKYFTVVAITDTTLTIAVNTDYVLANAAITANFYSHQASPVGYPTNFTFDCAPTGFAATPTQTVSKFSIVGRVCTVMFSITGTSNATSFGATIPVIAANLVTVMCGFAQDNGAAVASAPCAIGAGQTTCTFSPSQALGNWTASAGKRADVTLAIPF